MRITVMGQLHAAARAAEGARIAQGPDHATRSVGVGGGGPNSAGGATLSGQALMLSRLFDNGHVQRDSELEKLTSQDKALLGYLYSYASARGADLREVDCIARDLAKYRSNDSAIGAGGKSEGMTEMNEHEALVAKRILEGDAFSSTLFDKGFLRAVVNGPQSASRKTNLDFLEHVVTRFSHSARAQSIKLPEKFAPSVERPITGLGSSSEPDAGEQGLLSRLVRKARMVSLFSLKA